MRPTPRASGFARRGLGIVPRPRGRRSTAAPGKTTTCPRLSSGTALVTLLALAFPAYASSQCPSEFGPKPPIVNLLGWLVVALGVVVGGLLFAYLVRRTRGMRRFSRCAVIGLGFCGMIAVWVGGLALAFVYFFFQC
ncbi:hypothetical protein [Xanthomonas tesorieronis]|uniref:hypothetical protein n=1 Tax=Xanthomonas tesorieronis TaxID=3160839 RepID=UPI00351927D0